MIDDDETVPEFDDPSYADLRALLADSAADDTVPDDVAARLDATLFELVAQRRADGDEPDPVVVPLRRRRPWGSRLLTAAAAVVLVGGGALGVNEVLKSTDQASTMSSADSSGSGVVPEAAADGAGEGAADAPPTGLEGKAPDLLDRSTDQLSSIIASKAARLAVVGRFSRAGFATEATRYVQVAYGGGPWADAWVGGRDKDLDSDTGSDADAQNESGSKDDEGRATAATKPELANLFLSYATTPRCPGPEPSDGSVVLRITFAGKPATLVLHPAVEGSRFVAAWSCDGTRLLAYTTVTPER